MLIKRSVFKDALHIISACLKAMFQLLRGRWAIRKMRRPVVAIFGGKGAPLEGAYARQAYDIAAACVAAGASVLTGGGPGLMEAANCGALDKAQELGIKECCALGVRIAAVDEEFNSKCTYPVVKVTDFFARKWLLIDYSDAIIVYPGGIGTADELFHVLNLIKTKKMGAIPLILVDTQYWKPMMEWYHNHAYASGFIKPDAKDLLRVADATDHIMEYLRLKSR